MNEYRQAALAFIVIGWVAIIAVSLSGCLGSNIPIGEEPDACFVPDECVETVVDEFCSPAVDCSDAERLIEQLRSESRAAQARAQRCEDAVVTDTDTCDLTIPVGHRPIECRGRGHNKGGE